MSEHRDTHNGNFEHVTKGIMHTSIWGQYTAICSQLNYTAPTVLRGILHNHAL